MRNIDKLNDECNFYNKDTTPFMANINNSKNKFYPTTSGLVSKYNKNNEINIESYKLGNNRFNSIGKA